MALIKWTPFEDLDKFFEEDFIPMVPAMKAFRPEVDVYEEKNKVIVEMPLAGVDPKKVDISIEDRGLTVKGSVEEKKEEKKKNYYRKEIRRGSFERYITLPTDVKGDKAKAESEDGMLKIIIPKKTVARRKKVAVKVKSKKK